jgi:predicted transcriptional regulator
MLHATCHVVIEQQAGWVRIFTSKAKQADDYVRTHGRVATDVMSRGVVTAAPTAPLSEVVDLMERNRVKRILVTEGGKLVGIISRGNLVQVLAAASPETEGTATDDYRIRDAVLAEFRRQPWGLKSDSNVIVSNGVVHLWGLVSTQQEQAALRVAAESIPGVRRVADHTILSTENTSDSAARPTQ